MHERPILSTRFGMIDTRFAFPHRSPYPLMVPCTWVAPASTATRVLATARSPSLWQWMPSVTGTPSRTSETIRRTSLGRLPPLVSHSTTTSAPPRRAACRVRSAYSGFALYPSKKCSAS